MLHSPDPFLTLIQRLLGLGETGISTFRGHLQGYLLQYHSTPALHDVTDVLRTELLGESARRLDQSVVPQLLLEQHSEDLLVV